MYLHKAFLGIVACSCAFSGVNAKVGHKVKHEESIKVSTSPRTPAEVAAFEERIANRIALATPVRPPAMSPGKAEEMSLDQAEERSLDHVDVSTACTNSNPHCAFWANRGECVRYSGYMLVNCCTSCSQFTCYDNTNLDQPEFFPVCPGKIDDDYCDGTGDCTNHPSWCSCDVGGSFCQSNVNPCPPTVGYYDDFDWVEMPARIQTAWGQLGWYQQLWDSYPDGGEAWSVTMAWNNLWPQAQNAAYVLGYMQSSWDSTSSLGETADE